MGNALVDVLATLNDDQILNEMELPKGSMTLIDETKLLIINECFSEMETELATGGSAGNAIRGMACLGAGTGFIGYLGAAATLKAEDLSREMFKGYTYLFIEGYLVQDHDMILRAIELAKEAGLQICLDMASYNIVEQDHDFFSLLINKYVDIVFANEEEAKAFTGKEPEEALDVIAKMCSIAIVKLGARGSLIRKGTEEVHVHAVTVDRVIDTTGAGDYFAAGFLYGLTCGYSLEKCGKIGSILSGSIIRVIGAEMPAEWWEDIKTRISEL